eukprot:CAMPEP_0206403618 /NCGR_PEP_ID=MMETSP0294-20121207/27813_1 /ASSEMBLY_ACC=CAM_ASM_000327 /TAXON_ID=39354 /ORGANISM="Heterosigma akashiwo, Strain CCMP2393" /LENGTH=82 /DNA_ID=CAMNT_0053861225 /DNA_START=269 /DNA_END=514 /DNA_ORIENTATION=-
MIPGVELTSSTNLTGLRTIRVLRPLKAVSFIEEMKLLFRTFFSALALAGQATVLVGMCILFFANAGQILFSPNNHLRCAARI